MSQQSKSSTTINTNLSLLRLLLLAFLACFHWQTLMVETKSLDNTAATAAFYHHHHQQQQQQHLNQHHYRRRLQRDSGNLNGNTVQCEALKTYFDSIDIKLNGNYQEKGAVCGGHCCSNATEVELRHKARSEFERLLHHHTESLRGSLQKTANIFQKHILELAEQSENKTFNVFSQVYRRMVPLSKKLIHELYAQIMSHLKVTGNRNGSASSVDLSKLEEAIHTFFVNLFPMAYHQAVHLSKNNYGELHEDYINCLKHTFDDLQPFSTIPKEISNNLVQSVQTATIFMSSLLQSAAVLSETDELYATYLTDTCQRQLLKMSYCPSCNGWQKKQVKACYSYCMNVLRGCSAQYAGVLDSPWSNVVDAIDNLVTSYVRSHNGIVATIKQLDTKLSEVIMHAMENGQELENKVKKTCGKPKLLNALAAESQMMTSVSIQNNKWATPPESEILLFLSTLDKSKEFYSNIVNNVCEDEDIQRNDHHCWTGDRIGDYTQLVMTTGIDTQRYNPEVPLEPNSQSNKLNELVDKLLKIRKTIANAIPTSNKRAYSDIQSDMARHDEEGSGRMIPEDGDDEEYGIHGSGDGSGEGDSTEPAMTLSTDAPRERSEHSAAARTTTYYIKSLLFAILFYLLFNENRITMLHFNN